MMKGSFYPTGERLMLAVVIFAACSSSVALADSAHEWGAWNNAPIFDQRLPNAISLDDEQTRIGTNHGNLVVTTADTSTGAGRTGWVGYELYTTWTNSTPTVATMTLTPNFTGTATTSWNGTVQTGTLVISADNPDYNRSFDSSILDSSNNPTLYMDSTQLNANNSAFFLVALSQLGSEANGTYLWNIDKFNAGSSMADNSTWTGYAGKLMSVADIAALARVGSTYTLTGASVQGSNVNMTINFGHATWNGQWSGATGYYGAFNASGTISGNAITSTSVAGASSSSSATFVQGGSVSGDLIGAGTTVGVIGKTNLNVGAVNTAPTQVNDVFIAH